MNAARKKQRSAPRAAAPESSRRAPPAGGRLVGFAIAGILAAAAAGGVWLWRQVGPDVLARDEYLLDAEHIEITLPPAWVRSDVKAQVIRDGSLDGAMSILDETLGQRIADAFELHPWVRQARVTKQYPAKVQVELTYRRPVAVVTLEGASSLDLLPLDRYGVLLPGEDLSPVEKRRLPRLAGVRSLPLVGQPSDEPRVVGGARLASVLLDVWHELLLARIVPAESSPTSRDAPPKFDLITIGGTRIHWGVMAIDDAADSKALEKRAALIEYTRRHGSLEDAHGLDMDQLPHASRAANRPPATAPPTR